MMNAKWMSAAIVTSLSLAGCGTLSKVDDAGHTDEAVFPAVETAYVKAGTYPNQDNLRQVHAGVTRDQLYDLLGGPHFLEGFRTQEWDYLFHFNTAEGEKTCQYKVLFDRDMRAQSFYWKPSSCTDLY